jgi:hypothetical protein
MDSNAARSTWRPCRAQEPARVVLLGASNLARGFRSVIETARLAWGDSLEVFAAFGHGRSYGSRSSLLVRSLPSIIGCRLWDELDRQPARLTRAVIADIGNDILYGAPVPRILEWVEHCVERLDRLGAKIVMTELPLGSIQQLSAFRFRVLRSILFPWSRMTLDEALQRASALAQGLEGLAAARGVALVRLRAEWYGWDPIHIHRRFQASAWREILLAGANSPTNGILPQAGGSMLQGLRWYLLPAHQRWILGFERHREQPAVRLKDGTRIWIY